MKLVTLGTSHGVPEKDRFCSCNLIETGGGLYVFDAGAPLADLLTRGGYRFSDVKAVFITHSHADHICGIGGFVSLCNWYYKDSAVKFFLPGAAAADYAKSLSSGVSEPQLSDRLEFYVYGDGEVYRDENITVTACRSGHTADSHSFFIEAEGKRALITGDLDPGYASLTERAFSERTVFTLIECAHQSRQAVLETFSKINADKLLVTHVGYIVGHEELKKIKSESGIDFTVVDDGDAFAF